MGLRTCARSSPNNALLDANHPRSNPPNSATCGAYRMLTYFGRAWRITRNRPGI
jgi:hypothetical protein